MPKGGRQQGVLMVVLSIPPGGGQALQLACRLSHVGWHVAYSDLEGIRGWPSDRLNRIPVRCAWTQGHARADSSFLGLAPRLDRGPHGIEGVRSFIANRRPSVAKIACQSRLSGKAC